MKRIALFLILISALGLACQGQQSQSSVIMREALRQMGITVTEHNKVKLFFNGHDKFEDLFSHIRQAQKNINLEYFNFRNDSIASLTFDLLGEQVKKGVTVRAMFDAFGNSSNNQPLKKTHLKAIKEKGIEIVKFDPIRFPWINHVFNRDHRKIVVIDGRVGYTGGMNIADYYVNGLEGIGAWHDIHMRIEGEAVKDLQDIFLRTWNKETKQQVGGADFYAPANPQAAMTTPIAIVDRTPRKTPSAIRKAYASAIDAAEEHIQLINPYFVPTHRVRKALKKAVKRGVNVEIMIPAKSDIGFTPDAAEYVAHKLMKRGANIYLFNGGFHHSKVMMVDHDFCTVGTANLNSRSLRYDYETNAFIFDPDVTRELTDLFAQDLQHCTKMTPAYWKEKSAWKKFVGWVGNLLTPVL